MNTLRNLACLSAALAAGACVTINIYFPAAAAEKAADKIIDEVWQMQPGHENPPPGETKPDAAKETK